MVQKRRPGRSFPLPKPSGPRTPVAAGNGEREMECTVGSASRQVRLYSYDSGDKSAAQLPGCRTDGVTVVQNNDVRCVDVSVWRGVPF